MFQVGKATSSSTGMLYAYNFGAGSSAALRTLNPPVATVGNPIDRIIVLPSIQVPPFVRGCLLLLTLFPGRQPLRHVPRRCDQHPEQHLQLPADVRQRRPDAHADQPQPDPQRWRHRTGSQPRQLHH